ncbi:hypothetical protein T484DRAFT_1798819, partial [Baffinella frigidus]
LDLAGGAVALPAAGSLPTLGTFTGTLTGANFGYDDYTLSIRAGGTACEETAWTSDTSVSDYPLAIRAGGTACEETKWDSDTSAACTVASGAASQVLGMALSTAAFVATKASAVIYDPLDVTGLAFEASLPATGGFTATVTGANFGYIDYTIEIRAGAMAYNDYTIAIRAGGTACPATFWGDDTSATCMVAAGVGFLPLSMAITQGGVVHTLASAVKYDLPLLTAIDPSHGPTT